MAQFKLTSTGVRQTEHITEFCTQFCTIRDYLQHAVLNTRCAVANSINAVCSTESCLDTSHITLTTAVPVAQRTRTHLNSYRLSPLRTAQCAACCESSTEGRPPLRRILMGSGGCHFRIPRCRLSRRSTWAFAFLCWCDHRSWRLRIVQRRLLEVADRKSSMCGGTNSGWTGDLDDGIRGTPT